MEQRGEDFVEFLKRRYPHGNERLESELKSLKRKLEGDTEFTCRVCNMKFTRKYNMQRHMKNRHSSEEISNQSGGNASVISHRSTDEEALNGLANKHFIFPERDDMYDILVFMANIKDEVRQHVKEQCAKHNHIKFYMNLQAEMRRQNAKGEEELARPHFRSKISVLLHPDELDDHVLNAGMQKMYKSYDEYVRKGSSWTLKKIIRIEIYTVKYAPMGGGNQLELPDILKKTHSIVNVKNSDDKCFLWSILAALYPVDHNPNRISHYLPYENQLNMTGIKYPVHPSSVTQFERQNNISVNVFGFEEGTPFPLYISKQYDARRHIDLLYVSLDGSSHWCLIKHFDRFMNHVQKKGGYVYCKYCLQGFTSQPVLHKHEECCSKIDAQHVSYPTKDKDDILTFTEWNKKLRCPFVIYSDMESFCVPMSGCSPDTSTSFTDNIQQYEPCGFGYQVVCVDPRYTKKPVIYRGPDVSRKFIEAMIKEKTEIENILQFIEPMQMTASDKETFDKSDYCHICTKLFTQSTGKVRDHCHVSGKFRGASCNSCNLNFKHPNFIPVIFHNLKGFDGHILCQALGYFKDHEINCIAQNTEKYVSFSLGNLRFIDSYQFLGSSLETLVEMLASDGGLQHFHHFKKAFPDPHISQLLLRKMAYCYEHVDKAEKFDLTCLPPIECFHSHLTGNTISQEQYEHAQNVWRALNIQTLGSFHDLYLSLDVLLLADVFEHFRDTILEYFSLDPCYFYTAPGLSWSAALRMTKCRLQLLTDPDMFIFFENLRGGVSMISNKYAKANNPYVPDYDSTKPNTWIQYLDCNSLYAYTMSMELPTGGFRWLTEKEIESFDVTSVSISGDKGYVMEVDLDYPDHLHDDHSDLPVAPEHITVTDEQLSPYTKQLFRKLHEESQGRAGCTPQKQVKDSNGSVPRLRTEKLVPNLNNKSKYILHFRNLQQYLKLGLVLKKIHRIIEFDQSAWIAPYINFCAEKRRLSKSKSQSQFFKLLPNSFFGKTCEDLRKRINFKLVHTERKFLKEVAKSSFKGLTIFSENLVGMEHAKVRLHFNKPIYTGFCVLDMSKTVLYHFYYFEMKPRYPGKMMKVLWTDTDSLGLYLEAESLIANMKNCLHLFDTSNFPIDHVLYSNANCKKPGVMKDETPNQFISLYAGLKSKSYVFVCSDGAETKVAKGVKKSTIARLRFEQYKACLFDECQEMCQSYNIRSDKHTLYLTHVNKIGLSAADDKRYVLDNKCDTLAIGHYKTRVS